MESIHSAEVELQSALWRNENVLLSTTTSTLLALQLGFISTTFKVYVGWIKSGRHLWLFRVMELFQDPD